MSLRSAGFIGLLLGLVQAHEYEIIDAMSCGGEDFVIPEGTRFQVTTEPDDCRGTCNTYADCAGYTYILAGQSYSGGENGETGVGACYFRKDASDFSSDPDRNCYLKTQHYYKSVDTECSGANFVPSSLGVRYKVTAHAGQCKYICDEYSDCAGFNYVLPGKPYSGGESGNIGIGACYFRSDGSITSSDSDRVCYTKTYGGFWCDTSHDQDIHLMQIGSDITTDSSRGTLIGTEIVLGSSVGTIELTYPGRTFGGNHWLRNHPPARIVWSNEDIWEYGPCDNCCDWDPDGCSAGGDVPAFVPACLIHDHCYCSPRNSKDDCDALFASDLDFICTTERNPSCGTTAWFWVLGVKLFGNHHC